MPEEFKEQQKTPELVEVSSDDGDSTDHSPVGSIIGAHYEILSAIGEGGMSTVYRARHTILNRPVAVKLLLERLASDPKAMRRFQKEARTAIELNHSGICAVKEFGVHDGRPFLVMDLVDGESLAKSIAEHGAIEPAAAVGLMIQICEAIEHAHGKGVIHRDLKPANIIIQSDSDGRQSAKIVDFGIAKMIHGEDAGPNLTRTGEVFGTPNYMSPEQCLGRKVDQASDIYSLGCVFYQMLTGSPPFESESTLLTLMKHVNEPPPSIGSADPRLSEVVQRCMQKDPGQRYESVAQLKKVLEAILADGDLAGVSAGPQLEPRDFRIIAIVTISSILLACLLSSALVINQFPQFSKLSQLSPRSGSSSPIVSKAESGELDLRTSWGTRHHDGDLAHRRGDTEKALELYREAAGLAEAGNASFRDRAFLYQEVAGCARYLNMPDLQTETFRKAAEYARRSGDPDWYQRILGSLVRVEIEQRQYDRAVADMDEIVRVVEGLIGKDSAGMIPYLRSSGRTYLEAGRPEEAMASLEQALALSERFPGMYRQDVAQIHHCMGLALEKKGNFLAASEHLRSALQTGRLSWLSDKEMVQFESDLERVSGRIR